MECSILTRTFSSLLRIFSQSGAGYFFLLVAKVCAFARLAGFPSTPENVRLYAARFGLLGDLPEGRPIASTLWGLEVRITLKGMLTICSLLAGLIAAEMTATSNSDDLQSANQTDQIVLPR